MAWRELLDGAPDVDARNGVRYREVPTGRALNHVRGVPDEVRERFSFDLTLNPYLNCELGCVYCYAREFADRREGRPAEFDRAVYARRGAAAVLRREVARLARLGQAGRPIALGTATDPYQPLERRAGLTRALLEVLATVDGVRLQVTTKSDLVLRDLDVLRAIGRRGHARVNVTLTTLDRDLARRLEPRAPTPERRLRALEGLARAGVPAGAYVMPVLPAITDAPRDLRALVCAAQAAGARWFAARPLFLRGVAVRETFLGWLARERPDLVDRYRRWYRGPEAVPAVAERIERVVVALRRQYGLPASVPMPEAAPGPRQMSLFEGLGDDPQGSPTARPGGRRLPCAASGAA